MIDLDIEIEKLFPQRTVLEDLSLEPVDWNCKQDVKDFVRKVIKHIKPEPEWDHATKDYEIGWNDYQQNMEARIKELGL